MPYKVIKRGAKHCVVKSDDGKTIGCHDTEPAAKKQMAALYMHEGLLPADVVEALCPPCAAGMRERGWTHLNLRALVEAKGDSGFPETALRGLCKSIGGKDGFRSRCMEKNIPVDDIGAFCNWMKAFCHGSVKEAREALESPPMKLTEGLSFETIREALWQHLRKILGESYNWTLVATFANSCVVQRFPGQLEEYPLTVNADNSITLGTPHAVEQVFAPLAGVSEALARPRHGDGLWIGPVPLAEGATPEAAAEKKGRQWAAVIITEGVSENNRLYTATALQGAVELCEGVRAYWTHTAAQRAEPDPRDQAGFFTGARYGLLEAGRAAARAVGAILATFNATDPVARERLSEAFAAGNPNMFGLSINASGRGVPVSIGGRSLYRVDAIEDVSSVDVVSDPAAGGRFLRLVAGLTSPVPVTEEVLVMFERKLKHLREKFPKLAERLPVAPTEVDVDALLLEATTPAAPPAQPAGAGTPPAAPPTAAPITEGARSSAGATLASEAELREMRALLVERRVDRAMAGQTLPEVVREYARKNLLDLAAAGVADETLRARVTETVALADKLVAPLPSGSGLGSPGGASAGQDRPHKILEALEDYFFGDAPAAVVAMFEAESKRKPRRGVVSFRRLYAEATGDERITGQITEARALREALALFEGLSVSSWGQVFGNVLNRRLLMDYRVEDAFSQARLVVSSWGQPLSNLTDPQRLIRYGSYADLATIGERVPYPDLTTPSDEEATYTPAKRGGVETISREAILRDDLNAIRGLPTRIARAAKRTLYKFVMDLICTNPTIYDSTALFTSAHGNLLTDALSIAAAASVYQKLAVQTDMSGNDKLMLTPKILIVHPVNHETGWRIVNPVMHPVDGRNATEPNYLKSLGFDTLIQYPYMATSTNWFAIADPASVPTIEIGFVGGQEEPEMFVQDQANIGAVFTADVLSWKVRHEYGGGVVDYRGMVGGIQ